MHERCGKRASGGGKDPDAFHSMTRECRIDFKLLCSADGMLVPRAYEYEPGKSWTAQMFTIFFLLFHIRGLFVSFISFSPWVAIDAYSCCFLSHVQYSMFVCMRRVFLYESPTTHKMNKIHLINLKTSSLSFIVHFLLRYFHCLFLFVSSFGFLHSLTHTQGHERKIAKTRDKRGHHHCRCRRREQYSDSRNSCRVAVASI